MLRLSAGRGFLSTLSLRRATPAPVPCSPDAHISIHALLAESDAAIGKPTLEIAYFYPRSPCGERPDVVPVQHCGQDFYPRSPCGERPTGPKPCLGTWASFLSTLSLRRATAGPDCQGAGFGISIHALLAESDNCPRVMVSPTLYFYPRSPCGERQNVRRYGITGLVFLSTLSLRRATQ